MRDEDAVRAAYDRLAERFAALAPTKGHNAYYDRPAVQSLLPPLAGRRVLDAGCGPGIYAEWLVGQGATVVGVDLSPEMVRLARQRVGDQAEFHVADLAAPLDFLGEAAFDVVVSALALDYVRDWAPVFASFYRRLRAPGTLVFSAGHPADEYYRLNPGGSYFEVEPVEAVFKAFGPEVVRVPYFRRPLGAMIAPLRAAGFALDCVLEPQPLPEFEAQDPKDYAELRRRPGFICFRAIKEAGKS
jgi:SAM-dependent methyltransferase